MISLFNAIVALLNASRLSPEQRIKILENCIIWQTAQLDRHRRKQRAA